MWSAPQCNSPIVQPVEHLTVNQGVVGSSPTRGATWPVGQAVKTPPFHGGIGGSIPPPVTIRALSSAGRASALQAECQRFDPVSAHHVKSAVFERRLLFLFLHTKKRQSSCFGVLPINIKLYSSSMLSPGFTISTLALPSASTLAL